jgi:hypothetical protein
MTTYWLRPLTRPCRLAGQFRWHSSVTQAFEGTPTAKSDAELEREAQSRKRKTEWKRRQGVRVFASMLFISHSARRGKVF